MPYKEHVIKKKYYSIGEVATECGVYTSKIRDWQKRGGILINKDKRGFHKYLPSDLIWFKKIKQLYSEGLRITFILDNELYKDDNNENNRSITERN